MRDYEIPSASALPASSQASGTSSVSSAAASTIAPTPPKASRLRRLAVILAIELPLLAVGSLDHDCAALLKKHLADCPGCRASYEAHCRVLETVRSEQTPDRPLDTERVLARLRERMGKDCFWLALPFAVLGMLLIANGLGHPAQ